MIEDVNIKVQTELEGAGFKKAEQQAAAMASELKQLGDVVESVETQLQQVSTKTDRFDAELKELKASARSTNPDIEAITQKARELIQRLESGVKEIDSFGDELEQMGDASADTRSKSERLEQQIAQSTVAFEKAQAASISLKSTYKFLGSEAGYSREELQGLSEQIAASERHEQAVISQTRTLIGQFRELGDTTPQLDNQFRDLNERMNKAEGYLTGVTQEVRALDTGFKGLRSEMGNTGEKIEGTTKAVQGMNNTLEKTPLKTALITSGLNIIQNALEEAARAAITFAQESIEQFETFETGIREIYTLLPGMSAEAKEALSADAQELATELNRLPEEVLPAIYQALSSGVSEDNVIETVRISSEAARAGVAELDDTLKLGLAVMNSHVKGVNSLEDVYDVLFHTVKEGVITMPELNGVLSQVTSVAGEAGVSLQDIGAALITMTKQGDSAEEAAELLSIMLTQLSTSGTTLATVFEEAAGQSFRRFTAEGGTLAEAMALLQNHANNTGQALGDILGGGSPFFRDTQAARGALELTGARLADLQAAAESMTEATGSMRDAADEFTGSQALARQEAEATTAVFKTELGEALAPMTQAFYETKTAAAEYLIARLAISQAHEEGQISGLEAYKMQLQLAYTGTTAAEAQRELAEAIEEKNAAQEESTNSGQDAVEQLALSTASAEEFLVALQAIDPAYAAQTENATIYWQAVQQHAAETAQAAQEVANSFGQGSKAIVDQYGEVVYASQKYVEQATIEGVTESALADRYTLTAEQRQLVIAAEVDAHTAWARSVELKQQMLNADLEGAAVAEDRARRIAEAAEAEAVALQQSQAQFGQYVLNAAYAKERTINWTEELFQAATQQGINTTQIGLLAAATGEYSEEQIQAMLTEAAMRQAVEELGAALANKKITVQEALDQLVEFKNQLANPETAELDYSDFTEAKTAAEEAKAALLAAEGDYSATFTTTYTESGTPPGGSSQTPGSSGDPATPLFYGGKTKPGQAYLVGDDRGKPTPFSEIFVPDVPGTVIGVNDTAALLRNQGEPTESYGYTSYGNFSQPGQGQQQPGYVDQRQIVVHNHSAEAAALTMASVQVPKRARRNAWMGL